MAVVCAVGLPESSVGDIMEQQLSDQRTNSKSRARLRTDSWVGMPVSPWSAQVSAQMEFGVPVMSAAWAMESSPMPAGQQLQPRESLAYGERLSFAAPHVSVTETMAVRRAAPPGVFITPSRASPSTVCSEGRTTVMLRNLPQAFSREDLLRLLDSKGFECRYDFVYVPLDFDKLANLGHAFVNMVTLADVERLWAEFDGFSEWPVPHDSKCSLAWNDKQQGLHAMMDRYRNSPVMHKTVPDQCKPLVFNAGVAVAFPSPTQAIKAPKFRKKGSSLLTRSSLSRYQVSR